jgi:CDP-paratose 2-epimerase
MHILIAGGAGFVGSNLAIFFRQQYPGYHITCIDNLSRNGSALNLPRLQENNIQFVKADTRYFEQLQQQQKVDIIIDAAAEPSVLAGLADGLDYLVQTNINGTVNLLKLAKQHMAGFIFLSTSRVYPIKALTGLNYTATETRFQLNAVQSIAGCSDTGISEDFPLHGSRSLYGATKLASELLVEEFHAFFGVSIVINRFGVIAGPWQMGKIDQGVVALWMAHHIRKKPLQYIGFNGSGKQVRDLLHIHDLCTLIDYQLHHMTQVNGQLYNVGGGLASSASMQELTQYCAAISGHYMEVLPSGTDRLGDIPVYITNNNKVTAATGWKPQKNTQDIIHDTYHWMMEHEALLKSVFA